MFQILLPLPLLQNNICFSLWRWLTLSTSYRHFINQFIIPNFSTLDVSAFTGYAVAYDEETRTIFYYHTDELPSLTVLRQIKLLYPNAKNRAYRQHRRR